MSSAPTAPAVLSFVAAMCCVVLAVAGCTSSSGGGTSPSASVAPPGTVTQTTTAVASSSPATSSSATAPTSAVPAGRVAPKLTDFRIADVTFVGDQVWELGTATCLTGGGSGCSAIEHSADGGRTWASLPTPVTTVLGSGNVASTCSRSCVEHIRFATTRVGYLFGPGTFGAHGATNFYLTTDGGLTWHGERAGSAEALESLDGDVIRVTSAPGCPPGCAFRVQTAAVGSTAWRTVVLPGHGHGEGDSVELARVGSRSYLEVYQNPAGGAEDARADLYVSTDGGARWSARGEPCPQAGGHEVDSLGLTTAPDGSVDVLCLPRTGAGSPFIATSTDAGASFHANSRSALGAATITAFAAASAKVLLVSSDSTYRSADGGRRFSRLGRPGPVVWLGFESTSVGHAVGADRATLWTTRNAGVSWSAYSFR